MSFSFCCFGIKQQNISLFCWFIGFLHFVPFCCLVGPDQTSLDQQSNFCKLLCMQRITSIIISIELRQLPKLGGGGHWPPWAPPLSPKFRRPCGILVFKVLCTACETPCCLKPLLTVEALRSLHLIHVRVRTFNYQAIQNQ